MKLLARFDIVNLVKIMHKPNKTGKTLRLLLVLLLCTGVLSVLIPFIQSRLHPVRYIRTEAEKQTVLTPYLLHGEVAEDEFSIPRGAQVTIKKKGDPYSVIEYQDMEIKMPNENLADSLEEVVDIPTVYPRKTFPLFEEKGSIALSDLSADKGEALKVLSISPSDLDPVTGEIAWIEVEKDGQPLWIPGTWVETTRDLAMKEYGSDIQYNPVYDQVYEDGWSKDAYISQADMKGSTKKNYEDNPLRSDIAAVHITLENLVKHKDEILALKDRTSLNALVVALKGPDGQLWYESDVPQDYFNDPSAPLQHPLMSKDELKDLFRELKQQGFYIIGRMETFEDSALAFDRPEWAVTDRNNNPARYSEDYWVSPYCRDVWEYNGALAKEFADLGVNEVQFDFCRFPDGTMADVEAGRADLKNTTGESKVSAIQSFLYYIRTLLEPEHVYAAADVYAGPVIDHYDYDIGHFYPAISAASDIICPMMYLDSFDVSSYGYTDLYRDAGKILETFTASTRKMDQTVPNPALMRIWLQGYNDTSGERIAQEINGVRRAGAEGYMLWTDKGNPQWLEQLESGLIAPSDSAETTRKPSTGS